MLSSLLPCQISRCLVEAIFCVVLGGMFGTVKPISSPMLASSTVSYGPKTRWLWVSKKPPLSVVYVDTPVRRARSDARRIRGLE